jgi:hypothetical protein
VAHGTYTVLLGIAFFVAFNWAIIRRLNTLLHELRSAAPGQWQSLGAPRSAVQIIFGPNRVVWRQLVRGGYKELPDAEAAQAFRRYVRHLNLLFSLPFLAIFVLLGWHLYGALAV